MLLISVLMIVVLLCAPKINITIDQINSGYWQLPVIVEYSGGKCPKEKIEEFKNSIIIYNDNENIYFNKGSIVSKLY